MFFLFSLIRNILIASVLKKIVKLAVYLDAEFLAVINDTRTERQQVFYRDELLAGILIRELHREAAETCKTSH